MRIRLLTIVVFASGCVVHQQAAVRDTDAERIDRDMAREDYTDATPGAQGIALAGAPALAEPFPESEMDWQRGLPPWGWGWWGGGWPTGPGYGVMHGPAHHGHGFGFSRFSNPWGGWSPGPWR